MICLGHVTPLGFMTVLQEVCGRRTLREIIANIKEFTGRHSKEGKNSKMFISVLLLHMDVIISLVSYFVT